MTLQERIELYNNKFSKFQPLYLANNRRIEGLWIMGQNYAVKSGYYGGYPHGYLARVMSMFPDRKQILHLFSGSISKDQSGPMTFDINSDRKPDICGNAENLSGEIFQYGFSPNIICCSCGAPEEEKCDCFKFDLILADPPYSQEDANHYGTPMVSRKKVLNECHKVLKPGGIVVWLDQVFPMFSKEQWDLIGVIGMVKSTNHRVRAVFMFEKKGKEK